ncbi:MAG: hypothetical protein WA419_11910 [Silvibacterium sp.]
MKLGTIPEREYKSVRNIQAAGILTIFNREMSEVAADQLESRVNLAVLENVRSALVTG